MFAPHVFPVAHLQPAASVGEAYPAQPVFVASGAASGVPASGALSLGAGALASGSAEDTGVVCEVGVGSEGALPFSADGVSLVDPAAQADRAKRTIEEQLEMERSPGRMGGVLAPFRDIARPIAWDAHPRLARARRAERSRINRSSSG